ncbi:MAG: low molecular weight protein-tyrosine-phosphatase [Rhodoferax sp.]|nr:low molecular weight protein-tyrosine-phosphatase [Rhodoferax sp.]MDZ7922241.1 low molecular weight protein-tyrosine-phosphatase [Rhodoferax sp.]
MRGVVAQFTVLFVCMGNICRSPTAHGVMRHKVAARGWGGRVQVDSAGTHNYHPGEPPDARSLAHANRRGYDFADLRARQMVEEDFARADLIRVMDWDNLALVQAMCPPYAQNKVRRLTEFCQHHEAPVVPDPYYGGDAGFESVLDLVEDACDGVLLHLEQLGKPLL